MADAGAGEDNLRDFPPEKRTRVTTYCCVPQCSRYAGPNTSFHKFPRDPMLKKKWEAQLKMGKAASSSMRVCSTHFIDTDYFPSNKLKKNLFPHAFPTHNLPVQSTVKPKTAAQTKQLNARRTRAARREQRFSNKETTVEDQNCGSSSIPDNSEGPEVGEAQSFPSRSASVSIQVNLADFREQRHSEGRSFADILSEGTSLEKCSNINFLPEWAQDSCETPQITLSELLTSKEKLFTFTGLHSIELLDALVDCVEELVKDSPTNKKIMSLKNRVVLTLVKIKQNMDFTAIGILFNINRQTCTNYFKDMCPVLAIVLKTMILWPDQSLIRCNLPLSFKNFKNTRIVLDCCEVTIEKCKCLKCRVLTYSQYKKNHTIKFNMGVAPSGLITECSPPFGGRASDKLIVEESAILDRMDYGDGVMVDKGYHIEKQCMERNLQLHRPPFLSKSNDHKLSREEALHCSEVARARVHIERVFQRMRQYELLVGPVTWPLAPYFEDCLTIAIGLTNLGPPVINIDKFM